MIKIRIEVKIGIIKIEIRVIGVIKIMMGIIIEIII